MPKGNSSYNWDEDDWKSLLNAIDYDNCTPFLGDETCWGCVPRASDMAQAIVKDHPKIDFQYPTSLTSVLQYLGTFIDRRYVRHKLVEKIKEIQNVQLPDFSQPDEPHIALARLRLPVYFSTHWYDFMVDALQSPAIQANASRDFCHWSKDFAFGPPESERRTPSPASPLVYHLHGHISELDLLVLTEDDYLDYLAYTSAYRESIPPYLHKYLGGRTLLFIGYRITDLDFRVLLRTLSHYRAPASHLPHLCVQVDPGNSGAGNQDPQSNAVLIKKTKDYLSKYGEQSHVGIYFGSSRDFIKDLNNRWKKYKKVNKANLFK